MTPEVFVKKLSSLDAQKLKIVILDRARTTFDDKWQAEYFWGNFKEKAKRDSKWLVDLFIEYNYSGSEEELAKYFLKEFDTYLLA